MTNKRKITNCLYCNDITENKKFCSKQCSNVFNSKRPDEKRKNQYGVPKQKIKCISCCEEKPYSFFSYINKKNYNLGKKNKCKKMFFNRRKN